jgi:hypothetical protein
VSLDQKRARWFGVLYLITFVTSIPALLLYEPALRDGPKNSNAAGSAPGPCASDCKERAVEHLLSRTNLSSLG